MLAVKNSAFLIGLFEIIALQIIMNIEVDTTIGSIIFLNLNYEAHSKYPWLKIHTSDEKSEISYHNAARNCMKTRA